MRKNKESQLTEDAWYPLSPGTALFPGVHCLLLNIGSMFLKSLSGIMNDHGVVEIKQH
jgi:hypothetical protein